MTNSVSGDALTVLVEHLKAMSEQWRRLAAIPSHESLYVQGLDKGREWCADELDALLAAGPVEATPPPKLDAVAEEG